MYGSRGQMESYIHSYLIDFTQFFVINGKASDFLIMNTDVSQGAFPGQLLFLTFINNIHQNLRSSDVLIFEDDAAFLHQCKNETEKFLKKNY